MLIDYANAHHDAFLMLCKTCRVLRIIGELESSDKTESVSLLTDYDRISSRLRPTQALQALYLSHFDLAIEQNVLDVVSVFSLVPDGFKDVSLSRRPTSFHEFVYWKFAQVFSILDDAFCQLESRFPKAFNESESWILQPLKLNRRQMMVLKQLFHAAFPSVFFVDFAKIKEGLESERQAAIRSANGLGQSTTSATGKNRQSKKQASKSDKGRGAKRGAKTKYDPANKALVKELLAKARKELCKIRLAPQEKYDAIINANGTEFITEGLAPEDVTEVKAVAKIITLYAK